MRQVERFTVGSKSDLLMAALGFSLLSAGLALIELSAASLASVTLAGLFSTLLASRCSGLISLSSVFFVASLLYAVSGPLAALAGTGLPEIFGTDLATDEFLFHTSLGFLCALFGYALAARGGCHDTKIVSNDPGYFNAGLYQVLLAGGIVGAVALALQLVNYGRIGGFAALAEGKAHVQSELSELVGDLPVDPLINAAAFFAGLGLSAASQVRLPPSVLLAVVFGLSGPLFAAVSYLYVGRRLELVGIGLAFLCGRYVVKSPPQVTLRIAAICLSIYLAMTTLYGVRDILPDSLRTGDYSEIRDRLLSGAYWADIINPGSNEFGAPLGNYSAYTRRPYTEYLFGSSYLEGLSIAIPRLLWPDKPISVAYQFRDEYFPAERERGAIAGTGFSSVLEAYMNFGVMGVAGVYFFLGLFFGAFDRVVGYSIHWVPRLGQALLMPFAFSLPRSSFDAPYFFPLIGIGATSLVLFFVRSASRKF